MIADESGLAFVVPATEFAFLTRRQAHCRLIALVADETSFAVRILLAVAALHHLGRLAKRRMIVAVTDKVGCATQHVVFFRGADIVFQSGIEAERFSVFVLVAIGHELRKGPSANDLPTTISLRRFTGTTVGR